MFRMGGKETDTLNDWTKLIAYRRGMEVSRWHTRQPVFPETVGHHSANVALICHYLTEGECTQDLLFAALIHDVGEFYTGDLPAPIKVTDPGLKERVGELDKKYLISQNITPPTLAENEMQTLRAADVIDLLFTSRLEIALGNDDFIEVFHRGVSYIAMVQLPAKQQAKVNKIVAQLEEGVEPWQQTTDR